jgi:hypothetical protein
MSTTRGSEIEPPLLPGLEQALVRAARARRAHRLPRRRWALAVALGLVVLAAGVATATGVLDVTSGKTAHGTFTVKRRALSAVEGEVPAGSICLELTYRGDGLRAGTSYGCGRAPSPARPFGLVTVDYLAEGLHEEVAYGLVAGGITRVAVLGPGGRHTYADTEAKEDLPGRFFAVVVPHRGQVELVGYGSDGRVRARIGSLAPPDHPPRSKEEAVEQGEQMGFAPTLTQPRLYLEGQPIDSAEVRRLKLDCAFGRTVGICFHDDRQPDDLIRRIRELEMAPRH